MGRAVTKDLKWPRGVTRRELATGDRIQVAFPYQGEQCRELMPPGPITQTAINLAHGKRAEILTKIHEGRFVYSDYFPDSPRAKRMESAGSSVLLTDKLTAQMKIYEDQAANGKLSPSTLAGYVKAINSAKVQSFAEGKTLADVTPPVLREFIGNLGVTAKFARNLLIPLHSIFEDALNDELIEFDPFDRIALKKLLKQTAKASDYEVDPFSSDEREAIYKAARPDELQMVKFWFNSGLRPGELIAFKWGKVDWPRCLAIIDLNFVEKTEKKPKTAAGVRYVDLNDDAIAALRAHEPKEYGDDDQVWLNPRTGLPWESDAQIRKTLWIPLLKRAGVRYRNPYQARHTFASSKLTDGENPWYMAEQLGHVDPQMVFKIYGKFIRADYKKQQSPSSKPKPALRVVGAD